MSTKNKGHFKKGHRLGFVTQREKPLSTTATIRLTQEQKEILKNTPDWQERVRQFIDSFTKIECD